MILLICIPVALIAGLLWGYALGRADSDRERTPDEETIRQAYYAWALHWRLQQDAANAEAIIAPPDVPRRRPF